MIKELGRIIAEVQSLGVAIPSGIPTRMGGAGPAEAGFIVIEGITVSVPVASPFVGSSPYSLVIEGGASALFKEGSFRASVELIRRPLFYDFSTVGGVPYRKIALLHGRDCLATTLLQRCSQWRYNRRCRFCGIEISLNSGDTVEVKSPSELAEVSSRAKLLDGIRHVVITTGSGDPPGSEMKALSEAAYAIKTATGLPVHAQFLPPEDLGWLEVLKQKGVSTVGMHLESPDPDILSRVGPAKAAIGKSRYERAWRKAVDIYGANQVSSFLIAGLGEDIRSMVSECQAMADLGVYPFVVPLRPIPGSSMEKALPPDPGYMLDIYEDVSRILNRAGLSAGRSHAGCVRCGACSGLRAFESNEASVLCHAAMTERELQEAFAIRRMVFVDEQGLFEKTDQDEEDDRSLHLVAEEQGVIVGTVRVFPAKDDPSHWIGGRLAVICSKRANGAGEILVTEAVRTVKDLGCRRFTAMIQEINVAFFERLGWRAVQETEIYRGKPHRLMEADLG